MKVRCVANTGWDLSEKSIEAGDIRETQFDLEIDQIYVVYSMSLLKETVQYLISKEPGSNPFWYPVELFEIVDDLLPFEWYFSFRGYEKESDDRSRLSAVWGYKEMAADANHHVDLTEREPEALDIFFKRKKEIDEYEELNKFRERF